MREPPRHSSHLTAWIISILVVAVAYPVSVPVLVKILCQPTAVPGVNRAWKFRSTPPFWLRWYIAPMDEASGRFIWLGHNSYGDFCAWVYGLGN
jgi:hypothetical protein